MINGGSNSCARGQVCFPSSTPRSILNTSKANAHFSQSNNVALHGGTLLNHSWNAVIIWAIVWPVRGFWRTHTLAINRSSTE
jgi:hypothetical protein